MSHAISPALAAGEWRVDHAHSTIGFSVKHMLVSTFRGRFDDFDVTLSADGGEPRITGTVEAASLALKNPDQEAHLRGADFFDAERHPRLRFESTSISRRGDVVEVAGDLTIRGVTRPVRALGTVVDPREDPYGAARMGVQLEAVVDRREFGMTWNMALPKGGIALGNEVALQVDLELIKA